MSRYLRAGLAAFCLGLTSLCLLGCPPTHVTMVGDQKAPARPKDCEVRLFVGETPSYAWRDLARVEVNCSPQAGREACMQKLRKNACAVGGDTVYGLQENYALNRVVIGSVAIRDPNGKQPTKTTAAAQAAAPSAGCQYDTQCKGDRLCVEGQCVAPAASDAL